jgi:hypothetical protein
MTAVLEACKQEDTEPVPPDGSEAREPDRLLNADFI